MLVRQVLTETQELVAAQVVQVTLAQMEPVETRERRVRLGRLEPLAQPARPQCTFSDGPAAPSTSSDEIWLASWVAHPPPPHATRVAEVSVLAVCTA